jgi:hypothetical protein
MAPTQTFVDRHATDWVTIDALPGVKLLPLAQPVQDGSIHRARLARGTVIPVHTHPADEYVMVLSGTVETGGRRHHRRRASDGAPRRDGAVRGVGASGAAEH